MHIDVDFGDDNSTDVSLVDANDFTEFDIRVRGSGDLGEVDEALRAAGVGFVASDGRSYIHRRSLQRWGRDADGPDWEENWEVWCSTRSQESGGMSRPIRSRDISNGSTPFADSGDQVLSEAPFRP